jgi:LuxR family quorum sensing-dependent transcriptional regulator
MIESAIPEQSLATIRDIEASASTSEAIELFQNFIKKLGFDSYLVGTMANPASQSKEDLYTNWPSEWVTRWVDHNYVFHDPIVQHAARTRDPFLWEDAYPNGSKYGMKIMQESKEFGLSEGIAFPIHTEFGPLGCVSIGAKKVSASKKTIKLLELVCIHLYQRLQLLEEKQTTDIFGLLTKRETEVLHFVAEGKTNWEIGKILNLSEFSIKDHVHNLTLKLKATNRTQAVAVAIRNGLIIP